MGPLVFVRLQPDRAELLGGEVVPPAHRAPPARLAVATPSAWAYTSLIDHLRVVRSSRARVLPKNRTSPFSFLTHALRRPATPGWADLYSLRSVTPLASSVLYARWSSRPRPSVACQARFHAPRYSSDAPSSSRVNSSVIASARAASSPRYASPVRSYASRSNWLRSTACRHSACSARPIRSMRSRSRVRRSSSSRPLNDRCGAGGAGTFPGSTLAFCKYLVRSSTLTR